MTDAHFFPEWQSQLPVLTAAEQQRLERVKLAYANLARRSVLESTVKMAVVSPLLDLAGFFLPPFYVSTEEEVQVVAHDAEVVVRGRIDVLDERELTLSGITTDGSSLSLTALPCI